MSIFQKSVTNKYLKNLDTEKVDKAFENFQKFYGDKLRLYNIMQLKEENYQEGFLREIFVETLGYTINPDNNYNLTTEFKNQKDSRKADGAIIRNGKAIGVIELKSTKTKNLESIKEQAFGYKNNQPDCKYVITSNFQSLRFYIDNATEYEEFNLFQLDKKQFYLLYLLLSRESIFSDLPEKLKQETKFHEDNISARLYADYKQFKDKIFDNLVKNNPQYDRLTLFKKSQKLLDRFLFVFFAEDRGLIPPNAISKIIEQWKTLQELDEYKPLYNRFQKLFKHLDEGHIYKKWGEIPAYNGGLFRNDDILDNPNIKIDDEVLETDSLKLSKYDFNTEVDVNILGHIFEHSLNEIEEITAELSSTLPMGNSLMGNSPMGNSPIGNSPMGLNPLEDSLKSPLENPLKRQISKRKKDGVFYTPKYITKYIVENTVGKLCHEKKAELKIDNLLIDYTYRRKDKKINAKGKKLFSTLNDYKDWLLTLKILDPACGSGAFLNQTLDFLISEHKQTDDLIAELTGENLRLFDTDKTILENNIFGVDINEESVEIARLSLWLRTARKGRKLSDLSANIKCGNSLIDDPEIAGDKAFDWHKEFPQVFKEKEKEAFHIVLTTHNSRVSQRMIELNIKKGEPFYLDLQQEINLTKIIGDIINEKNYHCVAYNICKDHVHLVIVCRPNELTTIVKTIKGKSSFMFQSNGFKPIGEPLWSQKFFFANLDIWDLATVSKRAGYAMDDDYIDRAISYIKTNRQKHELPESKKLNTEISKFTKNIEAAFCTEYYGGFDVVIGNPPYVDIKGMNIIDVKYFFDKYETTENRINLYSIFIEKGLSLINEKGILSYINPNSMLINSSYTKLRKYIFDNITKIVKLPDNVFEEAKVETIIFELEKKKTDIVKVIKYNKKDKINQIDNSLITLFEKETWNSNERTFNIYIDKSVNNILDKLEKNDVIKLIDICDFTLGITPYDKYKGHSPEIIKNKRFHSKTKIDENYKPLIAGENITRYYTSEVIKEYIKYGDWLGAKREERFFTEPRILIRQIVSGNPLRIYASYTEAHLYFTQIGFGIIPKASKGFENKYILTLLNSNLLNFYHKYRYLDLEKELFQKILIANAKNFPIKRASKEAQQPFIEKADKMLSLNKKLQEKTEKFIKRIKSNFEIEKITKNLQNFYNFDFKVFIKELKKQKVKLSLSEQDEWEDYFEQYKTGINQIQSQINQTDKEIDEMVYELYGLSDEEIKIIESSIK